MTTTPRDTAPEAVAETLAATPSGDAPEAHLETLAVTADDVPTPAPTPTLHDGSHLPIVSREVYRIDGEIGRGGMGRVLRARDRRVGRAVAIKEALTPSRELALRFEREALITARLQHPSIIPVYECGRWPDGEPFYVMKLVAGKPLDQVIKGADDFAARAALLPHVVQVCEALAYAHARGVIHRDLKPGNVLCGDYGETVVVDWGLAKDLATTDAPIEDAPAPTAADVTRLGSAIGTPAYMAPEQARGEEVDARADVYALGAMLYHVLAGHPPYHRSKSAQDVIEAVIASKPPAPLGEDVPRELVAIVDRAMAASTDARYPSAGELAADLRRFEAGQVVTAHRYTLGEMVRRWVRRHRAAVLAASAIVVALGVVAVVMVRQVMQARDQARAQRAALLAESGRQELTRDEPARALPYLVEAWRAGRRDPALRLTLAEAARHVDDVERVVVHGEAGIQRVAIARDGTFATLGGGELKLWRPDGTAGPTFEVTTDADTEAELSIALSDDGALLAVTAENATTVYDTRAGAALRPAFDPQPDGDGDLTVVTRVWLGDDGRVATVTDARARFYAVDGDRLVENEARATSALGLDLFTRASAPVDAVLLPADAWPRAIAELRDGRTGAVLETITLPGISHAWLADGWLFAAALVPEPARDEAQEADQIWDLTARNLATREVRTARVIGSMPTMMLPLADGGLVASVGNAFAVTDPTGHLRDLLYVSETDADLAIARVGDRELLAAGPQLLDLATGVGVARLDGHAGPVTAFAVDPDGARLVTGGADGRAVIWRPSPTLLGSGHGVAAVGPDGRWLRADGGRLELGGAGPVRTLSEDAGFVLAIDAAWGADRAATLAGDRAARVWDLSDGRTLTKIDTDARVIALAPDGQHLALVGAGVAVFDDAGRAVATLDTGTEDLTAATWSGGGTLLAWSDGARPWRWRPGDDAATPSCDVLASSVRFSPTGEVAAIGTPTGGIVLCDVSTGAEVATMSGHSDRVISLAFSPDGGTLVSGSADNTARVWSVSGRRVVATIDAGVPVDAVAIRDDAAVVVTSTATGLVLDAPSGTRVWDARTGTLLLSRPNPGAALAFVPGGLAVAGPGFHVWAIREEDRSVANLDAAIARNARWRLDAGGLIATVTVRLAPPDSRAKTYDFSGDTLEGDLFRPALEPRWTTPASPAEQPLRAAWDRLRADDRAGAIAATAAIDGMGIQDASQRYALAYLRYLAADDAGALREIRAAIAAGGKTAPYLASLIRILVAARVPGAEAAAELRAAGGDAELMFDLARRISTDGRSDDAGAALDAIPASDPLLVPIVEERVRIARAAQRIDLVVEALIDALAAIPPGHSERASLLSHATEQAFALHNEYMKSFERTHADGARALYDGLLAAPDLQTPMEDFDRGHDVVRYAAELDYALGDRRTGVLGDLDKAIIRRFVRMHWSELSDCYERALLTDPHLEGTVTLQFTIDRAGRVTVDEVLGPGPLAACVFASAARWRFMASDAGKIHVSYPFTFRPAGT